MLDIILIVISALCMIAGLAGCILPFLPGPPIAYVGLVILHFTDKVQYSTTQFIVWLLIVAVLQVLDYFTPMLGSKYSGGSKWGNWGCIIGTLAGLLFLPWGIILGPLFTRIYIRNFTEVRCLRLFLLSIYHRSYSVTYLML